MTITGGYRPNEGNGCAIRADVVEAYVLTIGARGARFLQCLRATDPLAGTWHPVMGHCERGETAARAAVRELREEIGLEIKGADVLGMWAMEQTYPFFVHEIDTVVLSPRFAVLVRDGFAPSLNDEHSEFRWVEESGVESSFLWPGQRMTIRDILQEIVRTDSATSERLRVDIASL